MHRRSLRAPIRPFRLALLSILVVLFVLPAVSHAISRVVVTVKDPDGEPIEGVVLRADHPDTGESLERTTDEKGKATFALRDGRATYELVIRAEGYADVVETLRPKSGDLKLVGFTLYREEPATDAPRTAPGPGTAPQDEAEPDIDLPPGPEAFNEGVDLAQAGDTAAAEAKFLQALEHDDSLFAAHMGLAAIYVQTERMEEALERAETVLEVDPQNVLMIQVKAEALRSLGRDGEARETLALLPQEGPAAARVAYNEGAAAVKVGDFDRARERMERALALDPGLVDASRALAILHAGAGEHEAAIARAEEVLAQRPEDLRMLKLRWQALDALGRADEAAAARRALVDADPAERVDDLYSEAEAAFNAGRSEDARARLEDALALDPDDAPSHFLLGLAHLNLGQEGDAREHFARFLELAPDDPQAPTAREMLQHLE